MIRLLIIVSFVFYWQDKTDCESPICGKWKDPKSDKEWKWHVLNDSTMLEARFDEEWDSRSNTYVATNKLLVDTVSYEISYGDNLNMFNKTLGLATNTFLFKVSGDTLHLKYKDTVIEGNWFLIRAR